MILLQVVYRVRLHRQSPVAAITHYVPLIFNTKRPNTMRRWRGTTGALTKKKKEKGRKRGEIEQKRQSVSERKKKEENERRGKHEQPGLQETPCFLFQKRKTKREQNTSSPASGGPPCFLFLVAVAKMDHPRPGPLLVGPLQSHPSRRTQDSSPARNETQGREPQTARLACCAGATRLGPDCWKRCPPFDGRMAA